jgi:anti-sigma factor RsiW
MTHMSRSEDVRVHEEISPLIPWYVNGTLGERDRQRMDAHLLACENCRNALSQEQLVYQAVAVETTVEYIPAASLKRLQAKLDGITAEAPAAALPAQQPRAQQPRRSLPWAGLMAASLALMALALSLLAADRWFEYRAHSAAPNYYTVTTAAARAPNEVIRAVFSPTITLVELQGILDAAQLSIISGPTEAGVYSLAANSRRPVSSSLASLRSHVGVRFAESTQAKAGPGDIP